MNANRIIGSKKLTIGKYLQTIRHDRRLSLKQVVALMHNNTSDSYLSQLENEKINKPSPNILHSLSSIYNIDYGQLMLMAGYAKIDTVQNSENTRNTIFSDLNITAEEEIELIRYLKFLRSERNTARTSAR